MQRALTTFLAVTATVSGVGVGALPQRGFIFDRNASFVAPLPASVGIGLRKQTHLPRLQDIPATLPVPNRVGKNGSLPECGKGDLRDAYSLMRVQACLGN